MPIFYITRKVEFAAAHRLYQNNWSEEKNLKVFGACANPYGHGHNYILEVTVKGESDPETGMVIHFEKLKSILKEHVEAPLDHRHLNFDVLYLSGILPTSENLIFTLWKILQVALKQESFSLYELKLMSNDRNAVTYRGEN